MNPIIIESFFEKDEFMKSREVLWNLHSAKTGKTNRILLYISLVFFGLSILNSMYASKSSSYLFLIGGVLSFISIFYFLERNMQKRKYISHNLKIAENYESNVFYIKYVIDEESIKYSDNEKSISFKWDYFSSYITYQNYLILIPKLGTYLHATVFLDNWLKPQELTTLTKTKLGEVSLY